LHKKKEIVINHPLIDVFPCLIWLTDFVSYKYNENINLFTICIRLLTMRVFRKRKKFGNFHGKPEDTEPMPDIVYQMGAEAAAQYVTRRSRSQSPYAEINAAEQEAIYGFPQVPIGEENAIYEIPSDELGEVRTSSPLKFLASVLGIGRSSSRERYANRAMDNFVRAGSPEHFNQRRPGTPVKFRRRPASPELLQPRASSPYHFVQQERVPSPLHFVPPSRSASPDVIRRLQRAQLSQDLQHIERQQRRQQEMLMINPIQYMPPYQQMQQPFYPMMNPNINFQAYPMIHQPQMYSFY
jgi:hypothetical protein